MRTIKGEGQYTRKATGESISYEFEYSVVESISDIAETESLKLINRMLKIDANNTAREKTKSANGDSTAKVLTPEQKEANKQARKADSELLKLLRSKGLSIEDIQNI